MRTKPRFGLTLPNRGVVIGATTVPEMLEMSEWADGAGWDSVWVGDSIFAKPRLDAIALLGALAARTKRVRLGPACFASTPLRDALILSYQWCCLDLMSNGRTVFVAGQVGWNARGAFESDDFVAQVEQALANVVAVLGAGGAGPEHLVRLTWYVTDKAAYVARRREIGDAYRRVVGRLEGRATGRQIDDLIRPHLG